MANFECFGADYDDAKAIAYGDKPGTLPAGAYVLKIKNAKMRDTKNGNRYLALLFDIAEGECEGYYRALFDYEKKFDSVEEDKKAKWKGIFRIWMPNKEDDVERYKSSMSRLKAAITAINNSNQTKPPINPAKGWGEEDFKDKLVGGAFGEVEWEYLGRTGWKTECRWLADIEKVREDKVNTPEKKPLKNKPQNIEEENDDLSGYKDIISEDDLPF